ncbi:ankyrin repeat domain-containing protein [Actinoplanes sp. URMC 104]|uniref:ankyrin repeat domain-containing protein n=1 Tax=Actinoplanes sp. URMC 104 TaxID=3423409 RepID=UPI003F19632F
MGDTDWTEPPDLHDAAMFGAPPEAVRQLIGEAADVDELYWGRTALFEAVMNREWEVARELAAAGADPWRAQIAGWSPGRLALAASEPELFGPARAPGLTEDERAAVARAARVTEVLRDAYLEGMSVACVAGIDAAEAVRRLGATPTEVGDFDRWRESLWDGDGEGDEIVGVTDVPGGCVVTQWDKYVASTPGVLALLTPGTFAYGMYANPKSGNQGDIARDGVVVAWDLHPGGGQVAPDAPADEVLRAFLHKHQPLAYCADFAGLEPGDARAFTGPPDRLVLLPAIEFWPHPAD